MNSKPSETTGEPKKIDRYVIQADIGRGGMAMVYRAWDPRFDRPVAIKVLPREFLFDPSFRLRFQREAKTIASLEHSAIVPVHDYGEENGQPYLVMRYMTGGSLEDRIRQGILSLAETTRLVTRLAPALDYAHSKGVVHRDLKPANILFDQHNDPFIADFGIVKLTEATTTLTAGGIVGTPAYMSPEQGRGEKDIDGRADIYSLGAILFQMLTGRLPYESTTPTGQIIRHINDPIPNILETRQDLPYGLQRIIERCMAKAKEDRFGTVKEMASALDVVAYSQAADRKPPQPAPVKPAAPETKPVVEQLQEAPAYVEATVVEEQPEAEMERLPAAPAIAEVSTQEQVSHPQVLQPAASALDVDLSQLRQQPPTARPVQVDSIRLEIRPTRQAPRRNKKWLIWLSGAVVIIVVLVALAIASFIGVRYIIAQRAPTPTPQERLAQADSMAIVYIPAGEFRMGSGDNDPQAYLDEMPQHKVFLDAYWIDKIEVTNAQYKICVDAGVCQEPAYLHSNTHNVYYGNSDYYKYPVLYVSWYDAKTYCEWAGRRLPSEAEWEKAARGTGGRIYPWGDQLDCTRANHWCTEGVSWGDTYSVGPHPEGASPYGLFNMAGNVWEWVADWYGENYYSISPASNPAGSETGELRVVRGGAWDSIGTRLRTANRAGYDPNVHDYDIGFRCASNP